MSAQVPRHLIDEMRGIMASHSPDDLTLAEAKALLDILRGWRDRLAPPSARYSPLSHAPKEHHKRNHRTPQRV
jgi:hypothetical protein